MIVFDQQHMGNANHAAQFREMMGSRMIHNAQQQIIMDQYRPYLDDHDLQRNAVGVLGRDFWAEVDNQAIAIREDDRGREFLTDLLGIATPLAIGKTAKLYTTAGDISDNVGVSIDGNDPIDFDHVGNENEGDPVPIFKAGYGVNWRHWQGLTAANLDVVGDSQAAKLKVLLERMADYVLDGDKRISVGGYKAQGIRNHRNTRKVNMTVVGLDITNPATTNDQILAFFTQTLPIDLDANKVPYLDKFWMSPAWGRRLAVPFSSAAGFKEGTLLDYIKRYGRVRDFQVTYKLTGNEWFGYVRSRDVITPLVGAAVSTVPVPRLLPHDNYNFMLWGAMGLQIKADENGAGGVFYGANLT